MHSGLRPPSDALRAPLSFALCNIKEKIDE